MAVTLTARRPWLVGPGPDLLLGCGLGYLLLIGALALAGIEMSRLQAFVPLLILLTGVPHYGATLVRVYGNRPTRRRHRFVAYHLSAVVWAAFALAAFQPWLGSLLITLYLSWSPWHYAAQHRGLTLMFLGRGGIRLSVTGRRLLFATFVLSVAMTLLNFHRVLGVGGSDPMFDAGAAYRFVPLGIPYPVAAALFPALTIAYFAALVGLGWSLRRNLGRALLPAGALVLAQALWFAVPAALAHFARTGLLESIGAPSAFLWIAVAHSVQYLWVTHHFTRAAGDGLSDSGGGLWGARVLLAGAAVWVLPALALAPGAFGRLPFEAGLGLLVAAAVNLHHFVLDGAIWKLRDARVGRVLIAGERPSPPGSVESQSRPPVLATGALVTAGVFSVVCWLAITWEKEVGHRRAVAAADVERARLAADRLRFLGRDGPRLRNALGRLEERRGRIEAALAEYRRSLALQPSAAAWSGVARIAEARKDLATARDAYAAALVLAPDRAWIRQRLERLRGQLATALPAPSAQAGR